MCMAVARVCCIAAAVAQLWRVWLLHNYGVHGETSALPRTLVLILTLPLILNPTITMNSTLSVTLAMTVTLTLNTV